ncbi:MAG TPA: Sec-independent protein translocase protein TatB [Alphaproteobacteria bacterium]|jgi:sec-independent protein translocase protein TatB|nr:Sec-independent protein translocase protein TatB [Alphaproteobacteria bacterium]MDP7428662.1 Sec-independent protein translocase protein TatB [Alphaproteobacteria bacterium]HJM51581.1 Sec-independent protein translocase protein TatB [Alphaproteobacteria bacterium]
MFDIGWPELLIVAVITVIVVGPKELPRVLRTVMAAVRKIRGMASDFQSTIDDMVRESELDDLRKQVTDTADLGLDAEIKETLDPSGSFDDTFDFDLDEAVAGDTKPIDEVIEAPADTAQSDDAAEAPADDSPPRQSQAGS